MQFTASESDISNALVNQKNAILNINDGDERGTTAVVGMIEVLAPLWRLLGYGYKVNEICWTQRDVVLTLIESNNEYLDNARKNDRHRSQTEAENQRLFLLLNRLAAVCAGEL